MENCKNKNCRFYDEKFESYCAKATSGNNDEPFFANGCPDAEASGATVVSPAEAYKFCPICRNMLVHANIGDGTIDTYCEKCGWPDEVRNAEAVQNGDVKEYWKTRCILAERYINKSPCDPDIKKDQFKAYKEWKEFITKSHFEG